MESLTWKHRGLEKGVLSFPAAPGGSGAVRVMEAPRWEIKAHLPIS